MGGSRKKDAGSSRSATVWSPETKKLIKSVREVTNLPQPEIYAALKECNMDPDETVQHLLAQGMFQEVKGKRGKKKKHKETQESRARIRNKCEPSTAINEEAGSFAPKEENVLRAPSPPPPPPPPLQGKMSDQHSPLIFSCSDPRTENRGLSLDTARGQSRGHLSMADIVKMGRPASLNQCDKPSLSSESRNAEWPNLSKNPNDRPELPTSQAEPDSNDDDPKLSQSVEVSVPDPETIVLDPELSNAYNSSDRDCSATLSKDATESQPEPENKGGVVLPSHLVFPTVDCKGLSFGTFKPEDMLPSMTQDMAPTLETSNTGTIAHEELLQSLYAGLEAAQEMSRRDVSEATVSEYSRAEPNIGNLFNQSQPASTESPPNALVASRESDIPYSQYLANQSISNTALSLQDRRVSPIARTRRHAQPNIQLEQQRNNITNYSLQGNFTQLPSSFQQQSCSPRNSFNLNNPQQYGASMSGRFAGNSRGVFPNYQQYSPRNSPPVPPNGGYERIFRPQNPVRDRFPLQQSGSSSSWNMGGQQMTPLPRVFARHGLLNQSHLHWRYRQPQPQHRAPQYEAINLYRGPHMGVPRRAYQHQQNRGGNVSQQPHNRWRHQR